MLLLFTQKFTFTNYWQMKMPLLPKWQDHCNTLVSIYRWRGRNRLSYLRTKTSYDSHRETSEHPLIYDDANIHFYRSNHASSSSNTYLMDRRPIVRDLSGLSQQVRTLVLTYLGPNRILASKIKFLLFGILCGAFQIGFWCLTEQQFCYLIQQSLEKNISNWKYSYLYF